MFYVTKKCNVIWSKKYMNRQVFLEHFQRRVLKLCFLQSSCSLSFPVHWNNFILFLSNPLVINIFQIHVGIRQIKISKRKKKRSSKRGCGATYATTHDCMLTVWHNPDNFVYLVSWLILMWLIFLWIFCYTIDYM